jgi:hypothetical protein
MSKRYVATRDVKAVELGFDESLGLLLEKGGIYDSLLPDVEEKALELKAVEKEADWLKRQPKGKPAATEDKGGTGPTENK